MTEKIVRHPALVREDRRKAALKEALEAAQEATSLEVGLRSTLDVAHEAFVAWQNADLRMDRETQILRTAEHIMSTYGARAIEYAKRIEASADNPEFASAVTKEIERKSSEDHAQP